MNPPTNEQTATVSTNKYRFLEVRSQAQSSCTGRQVNTQTELIIMVFLLHCMVKNSHNDNYRS